MNTKKALIVVMILLILMNVALLSYIFTINAGRNKYIDTAQYTLEILSQRNIGVECNIPDLSPGVSTISLGDMIYNEKAVDALKIKTGGEYRTDNRGRLIFSDTPDKKIVEGEMNRIAVENISHDFINNIGLQLDNFTLDFFSETVTDEYEVHYVSKSNDGIYYFDSYIEMIVTDYGVINSTIYVRTLPEERDVQGNSLPIHTILLTNLDAESKPMTIEKINYGYHMKDDSSGESVMSWRVRFDDGSERFFEVGSGEEITLEQEILEYNKIKIECKYPNSFIGFSSIVYGESIFSQEDIDSISIFTEGVTKIEDNGIITYSRTSYENSSLYVLTEETIKGICNDFILNIGLDPQDFLIVSQLPDEGGIHQVYYMEIDSDGNLYFDNFINLHFSERGIVFAAFSINDYEPGPVHVYDYSIGNILLDSLELDKGQVYVIKAISSGYIGLNDETGTAAACWKVEFDDGSVRYLSVTDGEQFNVK